MGQESRGGFAEGSGSAPLLRLQARHQVAAALGALAGLLGLLTLMCIGKSSPSSLVLRLFHGASRVSYHMAAAFPRASNIRKQKEGLQLLSPTCRSHISSLPQYSMVAQVMSIQGGMLWIQPAEIIQRNCNNPVQPRRKNPMAERIPVHTEDDCKVIDSKGFIAGLASRFLILTL